MAIAKKYLLSTFEAGEKQQIGEFGSSIWESLVLKSPKIWQICLDNNKTKDN